MKTDVEARNGCSTRLGDRGDNVRGIQQALSIRGYSVGEIDGIFGQATLLSVRNFQRDNGLLVDGIVGKETMKALINSALGKSLESKSASKAQEPTRKKDAILQQTAIPKSSRIKLLDWFKEGYNLLSRNRNISIYDIKTGVTWNARYINGKNHADIIPASASDAKTIETKKIQGSYVRRPVIATIAGEKYAGSMYAVAHGETNYCNYFAGVMCLHFTGSKTHGTGNVDADHQKAIGTAMSKYS